MAGPNSSFRPSHKSDDGDHGIKKRICGDQQPIGPVEARQVRFTSFLGPRVVPTAGTLPAAFAAAVVGAD
jgi:hypothetical protein